MRRMRNASMVSLGAAIVAAGAAGALGAQVTVGPLKNVHGCLRPDVEKTKEAMRKAMEKGTEGEVEEVQKEVKGCTAYTITFQSAVTSYLSRPRAGPERSPERGSSPSDSRLTPQSRSTT